MAQLEFKCERCGKLLKAGALPGSLISCSHCQAQVTVPRVGPRPAVPAMPQVMGGARPIVAGPAEPQAAPPPIVEEEPSTLLVAMAVLMPWAISIVFHVAVLLMLAFFTFVVINADVRIEDEDSGEEITIATDRYGDSDNPGSNVVTKFEGIEPYGPGKDKTDFSKPAPEMLERGGTEGGAKEQEFSTIGIVVPGAPGRAGGSGDGTGTGDKGLAGVFTGSGQGGGRGSKFFGSGLPRAKISRIVYVVDSSGSMFETFAYVKQELKRSITQLHPRQQFTVVFFADGRPIELNIGGKIQLHQANQANKDEAFKWIDEQIARSKDGRTDPRQAIEKAFKVPGGPPELVYLLTDGIFPAETQQTIKGFNSAKKVHVNTIAFKDRVGEEMLQAIAKDNGGNYKYVSESELGSDY